MSNRYVKLDRTQTKDRLDGWTLFGYDNLRRLALQLLNGAAPVE